MNIADWDLETLRRARIATRRHDSSITPTSANLRPARDKVGRIDAISVETGRMLWTWETRVINYSPAVGSFFDTSMDRYLRALNADKGQLLWQARLLTQVVGGPDIFGQCSGRSPPPAWP